ncbi:MAG: alpha/beta hydrolase family protein [Betaproteobacteria bacterium]
MNRIPARRTLLQLAAGVALLRLSRPAIAARYDPLTTAAVLPPFDLTVDDAARSRQIPLRVYLPARAAAAPVVLFSVGLGGTREDYAYLGRHWAGRGYAVFVIQHPGSDDAVWKDKRPALVAGAMNRAASAENFKLRVADVSKVLDQLLRWNESPGERLAGRLDLSRVAMAGHSFGGITAQAVGGARYGRGRTSFADPRVKAAIVMSPNTPQKESPASAFGQVALPWLLMTSTHDVVPIRNADNMESRLAVYPALLPGGKYELVLDGAEHSAFNDRHPAADAHRKILALSTAFLDAWIDADAQARAWLDGAGPRAVLAPADRWQHK